MAEGITEAIQKALDVALKSFGIANSITVALENINAPTDTGIPYLAGFMLPSDVESAKLGEEMQAAVRQMIMNPPSKGRPRTALFHVIH